jgi:thiamine biosynthesis lipoprotein
VFEFRVPVPNPKRQRGILSKSLADTSGWERELTLDAFLRENWRSSIVLGSAETHADSSLKNVSVRHSFLHHWRSIICCMVAGCALALTGFWDAETQVITGDTMGTRYRIVLFKETGLPNLAPIQADIDTRLDAIENQMSTWRPESELSRFNASESIEWFPVSNDTAFVVSEAKRIWDISDGAFDPTVAPLIKLWHFAEDHGELTVPSDADIENARTAIGFGEIEVRLNPPALRKKRAALQMNLSAIAKGYAVDVISDLLTERDLANHLVEIGGEMRSRGSKSGGASWTAGIETPDALPGTVHSALSLDNRSLATSGDYRNYFEVDGQRFSHTIDPATARPITHQLASVSVLANRCITADALATAIEVLGPKRGMELAERENVPIYLILRTDSGFRVYFSHSFPLIGDASSTSDSATADNPVLATVLAVAGIFGLAIIGMAVGVIFSNRSIKGSCGGLANMPGQGGTSICDLCTVPAEECRDEAMRKIRHEQAADCSAGDSHV